MKKTIQVPTQLFRNAHFERETIDEESRTVTLTLSSDEPYERYWGMEILDHSPGSIDLARFKAKAAPLLFNHDRNALLGKCITATTDGHKLTITAKFSKSKFAEEKWQDVKDGILTEASVGYSIEDLILESEKDDVATYRAKSWTPYEGSLVTIPADFTVGIGRDAAGAETREFSIETENALASNQGIPDTAVQRQATQPNKPMSTPATPETPAAPPIDLKAEHQKWRDAEAARIKSIREFAAQIKHGGMKDKAAKLAEEAIEKGTDFSSFKERVLNNWDETPALETPTRSNIEVTGDRADGLTIGQRFVKSKEYERIRTKRAEGARVMSLEIDEMSNFRASFTTSSVTGYSGIIAAPQIQLLGVQRPTVADLLAQGTTNLTAVPFVQENAFTPSAETVAEGANKPEATFTLTQTSAPVRKIAVTLPVSDEAFEDIATLASYIDNRLRYSVEMEEEDQILNGDGNAPNLTGILLTSGIQTQAKGTDTAADALYKAITKVKSVGFANPSGIVIHPNDMQDLRLAKDANNQYYGGGPFTGSYGTPFVDVVRLWGLPTVETTSIAENTALIVTGMDAMIFRKKGITVDSTNSHASEFIANITRLRAEERLALAVFRPKSFCKVTGI